MVTFEDNVNIWNEMRGQIRRRVIFLVLCFTLRIRKLILCVMALMDKIFTLSVLYYAYLIIYIQFSLLLM